MDQSNAPSTKGKGLGMAGMIIGIVAIVISIIPLVGAVAIYIGIPGLIISVIAFFMAKGGNNPKKGGIITGIILNLVATLLAAYWIYAAMQAMDAMGHGLQDWADSMKHLNDTL